MATDVNGTPVASMPSMAAARTTTNNGAPSSAISRTSATPAQITQRGFRVFVVGWPLAPIRRWPYGVDEVFHRHHGGRNGDDALAHPRWHGGEAGPPVQKSM